MAKRFCDLRIGDRVYVREWFQFDSWIITDIRRGDVSLAFDGFRFWFTNDVESVKEWSVYIPIDDMKRHRFKCIGGVMYSDSEIANRMMDIFKGLIKKLL